MQICKVSMNSRRNYDIVANYGTMFYANLQIICRNKLNGDVKELYLFLSKMMFDCLIIDILR